MKHSIHINLCALLVVTMFMLVAAGAEALAFLPVLGCALMMGAMVWTMVRPGGHGRH
jgi:hypothetical protein